MKYRAVTLFVALCGLISPAGAQVAVDPGWLLTSPRRECRGPLRVWVPTR